MKRASSQVTSIYTYVWIGRNRLVPAQVVGEYLQRFGEHITVDDILGDATKNNSPLHRFFTWDNDEAGQKHRRWEARQIMNHLAIKQGSTVDHAYLSVGTGQKDRVYVLASKVSGKDRIEMAKRQLANWVKRNSEVKALRLLVSKVYAALESEVGEQPVARRRRA